MSCLVIVDSLTVYDLLAKLRKKTLQARTAIPSRSIPYLPDSKQGAGIKALAGCRAG
jgi:hypothetical protein